MVALFKDFNVKRQKAKTYDNLTGNEHTEKVKQLQAALSFATAILCVGQ